MKKEKIKADILKEAEKDRKDAVKRDKANEKKVKEEKRLNTKPTFLSPRYIAEKYKKRTDDLIERDNRVQRECNACHEDPLKKDEECNAICNKD